MGSHESTSSAVDNALRSVTTGAANHLPSGVRCKYCQRLDTEVTLNKQATIAHTFKHTEQASDSEVNSSIATTEENPIPSRRARSPNWEWRQQLGQECHYFFYMHACDEECKFMTAAEIRALAQEPAIELTSMSKLRTKH